MNVIVSGNRRVAAKRSPKAARPVAAPKKSRVSYLPKPAVIKAVGVPVSLVALLLGISAAYVVVQIHAQYTFSLQSPMVLHWRSPLVIAHRTQSSNAVIARGDRNGHPLTPYQQYTCAKFGPDCRLALAIQRAENPNGQCEVYHHNSDGTLDWGYFQINTVHLKQPGVNLRDLLDCKANIDFAYRLFREHQDFRSWSTYNSGAYRKYLIE